jgi:PAS domain S-box-containing protein
MNFRSGKLKAYTEKDLRLAERVGMQVAGAIANAQLYADLRQEEKARQENEQRFREIIENTQAGYFFIDREGLFQQVNGAWLRMHGFGSASEVIGRHFSLTQPETEMKVAERIVANLLAGEAISSAEAARLRRDGAVGYHTFSAHPVIREGRIVGCEGFIIDISTQRRLEEDYRTLFREMLDGFALHEIICDPQGNPADYRFLAVNPAFERLTGLRATDLVGRTVLEAFPGTERRWIETYGRVALTGEPVLFDNYHAGLKKHFDVAAFRPAPGQFACIFTDITERKRAEEERTRLQEQLLQSQKMESVGRLAGGVAHDFNNMLGVILGHADMAMEQLDPLAPLYGDLREIRKAAERSSELTRQLLAFARKQTVSLRVLDLNETLAGMLRMLQRLIGEDIQLVLQPGEGLWRVRMDPSQVDQILANLSVNARDAISGVGKVAIETGNVTLKEGNRAELPGVVPGDYVLLAVSDDGCGMSREILDKLFEPFFTTKAAGKGTGLGLATVYGIVKQNDGFIQVRSAPGEGTTFRIYLPRYVDSGGQGSGERVAEPVVRGHETVLVVEDERALLDLSRRMLEKLGYRVLAAGSPGEAMELAEQHSGEIHLLMTDVVMPDMNGRDLARNLLSLYPNLKRLFMSGYTADVIARHGVLDEGVHFIQKPFSKQELAARVRAALDRD